MAATMEAPPPPMPPPASRYDDLLRQIVQLNADLQKTAALSQALQRERDGLQHNNSKVAKIATSLSHVAARTHAPSMSSAAPR